MHKCHICGGEAPLTDNLAIRDIMDKVEKFDPWLFEAIANATERFSQHDHDYVEELSTPVYGWVAICSPCFGRAIVQAAHSTRLVPVDPADTDWVSYREDLDQSDERRNRGL